MLQLHYSKYPCIGHVVLLIIYEFGIKRNYYKYHNLLMLFPEVM